MKHIYSVELDHPDNIKTIAAIADFLESNDGSEMNLADAFWEIICKLSFDEELKMLEYCDGKRAILIMKTMRALADTTEQILRTEFNIENFNDEARN